MNIWVAQMNISSNFPLPVNTWIIPQPKQNVWVMLANIIKQETMCLSVPLFYLSSGFADGCVAICTLQIWDQITKIIKPIPQMIGTIGSKNCHMHQRNPRNGNYWGQSKWIIE